MYHQKPIITFKEGDFVHTDSMYNVTPLCPPKCDGAPTKVTNELDAYIVSNASARSKLGQALEAKRKPNHNQELSIETSEQREFKSAFTTDPVNETPLDKYIVTQAAPVSKLGKHLLNKNGKENCNPTFFHRLQELERRIDAYLIPMALSKPSDASETPAKPTNEMLPDKYIVRKTAPVSKLKESCQENANPVLLDRLQKLGNMIDAYFIPMSLSESNGPAPKQKSEGATTKPQTIAAKKEEKLENTSIFTPEATLPPTSRDFVDLAVHCDPRKPPFALLTYSRLLLISGRNVSVQFYRHSSLISVPKYLTSLERFFAGKPRSSTSDFILSVIWRPCPFGCMAIGNPFRDLPLFGESVILMFIARLSADFSSSFGNLSMVESAVSGKDETTLLECIKKVAKEDEEQFSPEEVLLFFSIANAGLSSVPQKLAKPWFDRCMKNDCITGALKIVDLCC
ncbi:hypothetical protein Aperf_G00000024933 [Anoplocephala perfoliata]